jgi:hypothetical protein
VQRPVWLVLSASVVLLLSGCLDTRLDGLIFACSTANDCPPGQVCSGGSCAQDVDAAPMATDGGSTCGDGIREATEECDDAGSSGGCPACRIAAGWFCNGAPGQRSICSEGWSPAQLPGLVLWLDGQDIQTTQVLWRDRSPEHNDAVASVDAVIDDCPPARVPLPLTLGSDGVEFDGLGSTVVCISDADSLQWGTGDFAVLVVAASSNLLATLESEGGQLYGKELLEPNYPGLFLSITGYMMGPPPRAVPGLFVALESRDLAFPAGTDTGTVSHYNDGKRRLYGVQRTNDRLSLVIDRVVTATVFLPHPIEISAPLRPVHLGRNLNAQYQRLRGAIYAVFAVKGPLLRADLDRLFRFAQARYLSMP